MSLGLFVLIAGVIFALVVAALPLWDIRHQLWATWDWRDLTKVGECQIICVRDFREGGLRFVDSVDNAASKAWSASLLGWSERSSPKAA